MTLGLNWIINKLIKTGLNAAGFLEDMLNDFPELKENLSKYHIMSMDFVVDSTTFTIVLMVDPKNDVLSYWEY